jgi:predicted HTH transcriptional regulator
MSVQSDITERQVKRIIKELSERGILRREGTHRAGSWVLIDKTSP